VRWIEPIGDTAPLQFLRTQLRRLAAAEDAPREQAAFLERFASARGAHSDEESNWFFRRELELVEQHGGFLTFSLRESRYEGAGEPISTLRLGCFRAPAYLPLSWPEIVSAQNLASFQQAVEAQLRANRRLPADLPLSSAGYLLDEYRAARPASFGILARGLRLRYDPGVLTPPEWGEFELVLPWTRLQPVFPRRHPLAHLTRQ
jgi:hypothetical protein